MKEALTLLMLAMLVLPLLIGVRRIRRLPRPGEAQKRDPDPSPPPAHERREDPSPPS